MVERMLLGTAEEWKSVVGVEGYEVSSLGQVRSYQFWGGGSFRSQLPQFVRTPRLLNPCVGKKGKGYRQVILALNGGRTTRRVNRLVAQAFVPNSFGLPEVNHLDGQKLNDAASNLEWTTQIGNTRHAQRLGLRDKLSIEKVAEIRQKYRCPCVELHGRKRRNCTHGNTVTDLAQEYNVHFASIHYVVSGKIWKEHALD